MEKWSQDVYAKAWNFACLAHRGQGYAGEAVGIDYEYINHIAGVAMEVIHALAEHPDYDANLAVQCALLHDTLEDTSVTHADLAHKFGEAVAQGVSALSKDSALADELQMSDSLARICQQPSAVWLVKLADRINNLEYAPLHWSEKKIRAYQAQSYMILETLGTASPALARRLAERIWRYGDMPAHAQAAVMRQAA